MPGKRAQLEQVRDLCTQLLAGESHACQNELLLELLKHLELSLSVGEEGDEVGSFTVLSILHLVSVCHDWSRGRGWRLSLRKSYLKRLKW